MDNRLRTALERRGLPADVSEKPLTVREDATRQDIVTRTFQVRAATIDEQNRSVEAVLATETPAGVMDYRSWDIIDEVLRMDGAAVPSQLPMLETHSRWSLDSVLGSIRNLRVENDQLIGRLHFAEGDDRAERAWGKVRQGHITDVSVGYRVKNYVDIPPGKTQAIKGREYTAGTRTLRISTEWEPREGSLVPIGADPKAKIREDSPISTRKDVSMEEHETNVEREDQVAAPTPPVSEREPERSSAQSDQGVSPEEAARQAIAAERDRVRQLEELAGDDVPAETLRQAIREGWDVTRASGEFLTAVRGRRQADATPYHATAITIAPSSVNAGARGLAAGLMLAAGVSDPTRHVVHDGRRDPFPNDRITEQDADQGHRLSRMSAVDFLRECVRQDTGRLHWDISDAFTAARSTPGGGTLTYAFSTSVYAMIVAGWDEVPDTTAWCDSEDVPNFLSQEDISLEADARLKRLARGDTAKDATMSDARETYKIARYARKWTVDEQDIIDDRLGAIMRMPMEMGAAARRLRPDLVYALLLANAALADTGALFNATAVTTAGGHANLTTAVLGATGLKAAILAMGKYRLADGTALNIKPRFLIVPSALQWTAKELLTSTAQAYTAAAAAATPSLYYPINVLVGENMTLVVDDRVGAAGVTDPSTGTARTGLDTNWFLSAGGPRTVRVAYRRGTNRQPSLRSFALDKGQWGMGWDINMDIGAKALDYRGMHKSTGAG